MAANATIITTPETVSAWVCAYNPIVFTVSSTNTAEANFRYVIDINIDYPITVSKRLKMSARPDGFLLIDIHRIIENYLSFDFGIGEATDAMPCLNSHVDFVVSFGVEYGTTPVVYPDLGITSNIYAIPAALKHSVASYGSEPDYISVDLETDYRITNAVTGTTAKFLTSSPRTITMCLGKNYYLYTTYKNEPIKLRVRLYNTAGTLTATTYKTLTTGIDVVTRIGVGTYNIALFLGTSLTGIGSYDVTLCNAGNTPLGETFTFIIDCDCTKYNESFRLHWLNPLGGFDAHTFNKRFDRSFNIKKANYTKILGAVDVAGAFTFSPSQAGKVLFDSRATESIKINSDWVTEEYNTWLLTLAKSTQVFWEIDNDTYAPVTVTNTSYKQETYAGEKLFNAEFTIEISNEIISQRQ
ncbi:hypothetical protein UFOVP1015_35 [uncultured Caudovirales phage]|uniref:Uncharacterized protein n=1 Tax=uncultured Caudovirales phage TaxID=2100421 RepID=A0A6J7XDL2_9CAUD|nr:hypothetical protein UFOVP1015_35 [uncultured Caudovirales phage]CAB5229234.1 hypothetical protein UFOVP1551_16 [uncultured Caudovirales phage]